MLTFHAGEFDNLGLDVFELMQATQAAAVAQRFPFHGCHVVERLVLPKCHLIEEPMSGVVEEHLL